MEHWVNIWAATGDTLCYHTFPMPTILSFCRFGILAETPAVSPSSIILASASAWSKDGYAEVSLPLQRQS